MIWIVAAAVLFALGLYLFGLFASGNIPRLIRALRWFIGGTLGLVATYFLLRGQVTVAAILAAGAVSVFMRGRLGPIDLTSTQSAPGATSRVRSRLFEMALDHESGAVSGHVVSGQFAGKQLGDIYEDDMQALLKEAATDGDSAALLESWLNANRPGWREHLGASEQDHSVHASTSMDAGQAYDILGLRPGATPDDIKAAHRRLLKIMHPDQGGSTYFAARINAAKDFLLKGSA